MQLGISGLSLTLVPEKWVYSFKQIMLLHNFVINKRKKDATGETEAK